MVKDLGCFVVMVTELAVDDFAVLAVVIILN